GATTTYEALSCGVPVVTLAGRSFVGRVGASHLTAAGLAQLIAADEGGYVRLAAALASDSEGRRQLRHTLPARLAASPHCDAPAFARSLEAALRAMWQKWCQANS
ncbi:MAG: hypothetical protein HY246_04335, partial [Proteobacteria bacterium]|nr:hypothetical protein [Pseudomonadota bacterium]